jgi:hypothetical protein
MALHVVEIRKLPVDMGVRKCSRDMRLDVRHLHAVYLLDRRDMRQSVALTAVSYKVMIANGYLRTGLGVSRHVHQARGLELEVEATWRSITPLRSATISHVWLSRFNICLAPVIRDTEPGSSSKHSIPEFCQHVFVKTHGESGWSPWIWIFILTRYQLSREEEEAMGEEKEVRKEDQDRINRFSRLHSREKLVEDDLKTKQASFDHVFEAIVATNIHAERQGRSGRDLIRA